MKALEAPLQFRPGYFERVWGSTRLRDQLDFDAPRDKTIGEAWLIADHAEHESVVAHGEAEGKTLRQLMNENTAALLGTRAQATPDGRFPLLLKLLDSAQPLSVQVHPDDAGAERLGEPDVGKTEMWHVFQAEKGAELICGLHSAVSREELAEAIESGSIEQKMIRFAVEDGASVFVGAGTVHAIGAGIVLAEIQQNSNITYRLYDWGRVGTDGQPRQLHVDKALEAIHFGSSHGGATTPLAYTIESATVAVQAACRYFVAELVTPQETVTRHTRGASFHIVLAKHNPLALKANGTVAHLEPGHCALVSACATAYTVACEGPYLTYYVPDLEADVRAPLREAGHIPESITHLGGGPAHSDGEA